MGNYRAILITGGPRSGKTSRAIEEAGKRGGNFIITTWEDISDGKFGLGRAIGSGPSVVIVEGLLLDGAHNEFVKHIVTEDELQIEEQYKEPRKVLAPLFIFTLQAPVKLNLSSGDFQRFLVIEL